MPISEVLLSRIFTVPHCLHQAIVLILPLYMVVGRSHHRTKRMIRIILPGYSQQDGISISVNPAPIIIIYYRIKLLTLTQIFRRLKHLILYGRLRNHSRCKQRNNEYYCNYTEHRYFSDRQFFYYILQTHYVHFTRNIRIFQLFL